MYVHTVLMSFTHPHTHTHTHTHTNTHTHTQTHTHTHVLHLFSVDSTYFLLFCCFHTFYIIVDTCHLCYYFLLSVCCCFPSILHPVMNLVRKIESSPPSDVISEELDLLLKRTQQGLVVLEQVCVCLGHLPICLSVCLAICMSVCLSGCLCLSVSACVSVYLCVVLRMSI